MEIPEMEHRLGLVAAEKKVEKDFKIWYNVFR
jgi:hypothetical protein